MIDSVTHTCDMMDKVYQCFQSDCAATP